MLLVFDIFYRLDLILGGLFVMDYNIIVSVTHDYI